MKTIIKFLFCSVLALSVMTCGNEDKSTQLTDYEEVQQIFSQEEIDDLKDITTYFEGVICKSNQVTAAQLPDCYQAFFEQLKAGEKKGIMDIRIPFEAQTQFISQMNKTSFDQVWNYGIPRNELDTLEVLHVNLKGNYIQFLTEFGTQNDWIKQYTDRLKAIGDIAGGAQLFILNNYKQLDCTDPRIRLFLAINYLTINDQYRAYAQLKNNN